MSWKGTLARWIGSQAVRTLWPRVKIAGSAAWRAFKAAKPVTEPPRESAPDVAQEDGV